MPEIQSPEDELLRSAATRLAPVLAPLGFRFRKEYVAVSSGGAFANGFFENSAVAIGLVYRSGRLGAVIYENARSNMSHDDIMHLTGNADRQRLQYDEASMQSVDVQGRDEIQALVADLELLRPFLTDRKGISVMVDEALRQRLLSWGVAPQKASRRWWQFWK